ncbi:hypothetical protein [Bradyrhizobium monzae]|nr:hypothetical protein [Bradyrhizobium sp. Oc8]
MPDENFPKDSLFIKLGGYFQAGATGPLANLALLIIALAVIAARAFSGH